MEFEGVVYKILPPTSGTSARGEWKRQDVVFELPQEFSRKICVTFFNKDSEVAQLHEGMACTVSVNVESREFNGRWYTDVKAWRVQPKAAEAPAAPAAPAQGGAGVYGGASAGAGVYGGGASASAGVSMPEMPPFGEEPAYSSTSAAEVDDLPF